MRRKLIGGLAAAVAGLMLGLVGTALAVTGGGLPAFVHFAQVLVGPGATPWGSNSIVATGYISGKNPGTAGGNARFSPVAYGYFDGSGSGCPLDSGYDSFNPLSPPSCVRSGTGVYLVTMGESGSKPWTCSVTLVAVGAGYAVQTTSGSTITVRVFDGSGTAIDDTFTMLCM